MKCKKVKSLIFELVMGTIGEEERRNLDLHLKGCPRCERERAVFVDLTASLKSLPIPDPGEEFWKTLPLRVEREVEKRSKERVGAYGRTLLRIWDWLFQPGKSVYAFVSMAIIMILTVLLFYPRYVAREGDMVRRGEQEITVRVFSDTLLPAAEDSMRDEEDGGAAGFEDLNPHELNLLYSSLISSVEQKRDDQQLLEERIGGSVSADIASELNDLNPDELKVLTQKLFLKYPEFQAKGVL